MERLRDYGRRSEVQSEPREKGQIHFPCYPLIHIRSSKRRNRWRTGDYAKIFARRRRSRVNLVCRTRGILEKRLMDEFGQCTCPALSNGKRCTQHPPIRIQLTLIPLANKRRGVSIATWPVKRRARVPVNKLKRAGKVKTTRRELLKE